MSHSLYYPIFLDIKGRKCVVIGGGSVAERKALCLLKAGGLVTVVSPEITKRLEKEKKSPKIKHLARRFRQGDIGGAFIVIAATDDYAENKKISEAAKAKGIPVNVVDRPELCSFIVPSVVRRGPLQIAISTSGTSPAMAKAIRKELEKLYGPKAGIYLKQVGKLRKRALRNIKDAKERSMHLKEIASDFLEKLRNA